MTDQTLASEQFVAIKEIKDGVVYLKNSGLRRVLIVSGINVDLKSDDEKELITAAFQSFLNRLDFPVQFFIHSRKINIEEYLEKLDRRRNEEENELLKIQIEDYTAFIKAFVAENAIIAKTFFAVIPYDPVLGAAKKSFFLNIFSQPGGARAQTEERVEKEKNQFQLNQRTDEVIAGLEAIGLQAKPLDDEALTELFYNLYNPQVIEKNIAVINENKH